jgi:hypothetical protein
MAIMLTGTFEDLMFFAERGDAAWCVIVSDMYPELDKPTSASVKLSDVQMGATLALLAAGDMPDEQCNTELYRIAEEVWSGVPAHLRLIP